MRFVASPAPRRSGCDINEQAAQPRPGQNWIKRVVAEMGGKDFIIVDETADVDAAATGIVAAAFGFQGQKCSACSRAIVDRSVYDAVRAEGRRRRRRRCGRRRRRLRRPRSGPVINAGARRRRSSNYIEIGKSEGRAGRPAAGRRPAEGYFIQPTVIADVKPDARIAQEEIFGPVLAIIQVEGLDEALRIANRHRVRPDGLRSTPRTAKRMEQRQSDVLHVGNLYLNRKCTGALVGVHPFGGFNMSGTDSKAGGRDYLLLFLQAKSISEAVQQLSQA